jgi:hypothetical protein
MATPVYSFVGGNLMHHINCSIKADHNNSHRYSQEYEYLYIDYYKEDCGEKFLRLYLKEN